MKHAKPRQRGKSYRVIATMIALVLFMGTGAALAATVSWYSAPCTDTSAKCRDLRLAKLEQNMGTVNEKLNITQYGSTAPTPTPTTTSPTPTPTPTPTSTVSGSCDIPADAKFVGSGANSGVQFSDPVLGRYELNNNVWNQTTGWKQTLWANSPGDWGVCSTQNSDGAVKSYPYVRLPWYAGNVGGPAINSLNYFTATYSESMPDASQNYIAEAAFDIWLNQWAIEFMVWVDNHGQVPAGNKVGTFTDSTGMVWDIWKAGTDYITYVRRTNLPTGTVNLLEILKNSVQRGDIKGTDQIIDPEFGWEICATYGVPMNFRMHSFSYNVDPIPATSS